MSAALLAGCAVPARNEPAGAQDEAPPATAARRSLVGVGAGFTASPDTFLLQGRLELPVGNRLFLGPLLQRGIADNRQIVAPSANLTYEFAVPELERHRLTPFVQGGVGFAWLEKEGRRGDDDEIGPLLNAGGGLRYQLTDRYVLASSVLFNVLPGEVLDERFFFSWQIAEFGVRF